MDFEAAVQDLGKRFNSALKASEFWGPITWLTEHFQQRGPIKLWLVGGTIRDFVLETSNMIVDVDLMVENCPSMGVLEEVISEGGRFRKNMMGGYKWYPCPEISGREEEMEIDLWRLEESIEPGDEPTPEMGVSRFDLNINSVGWDIAGERFINPLGGLESILDEDHNEPMELLTEKIKPGNAGRLILRAIKYSPKLGIPLGEKSRGWIRENENELDSLTPEKIRYVFRAINYWDIRGKIEAACDNLLSPGYAAKIKNALFH